MDCVKENLNTKGQKEIEKNRNSHTEDLKRRERN
jgi:hypothetical protein